jgi:hypothetical protein
VAGVSAHWHSSVPPELRELCEKACRNPKTGEPYHRQIAALQLKSQGYGPTLIGRVLGVTEKAARGLLDRATLNVKQEQAARQGYQGYP